MLYVYFALQFWVTALRVEIIIFIFITKNKQKKNHEDSRRLDNLPQIIKEVVAVG